MVVVVVGGGVRDGLSERRGQRYLSMVWAPCSRRVFNSAPARAGLGFLRDINIRVTTGSQ